MKDYETIKEFIYLRSLGLTYDQIKEEMNISKPTLIKWNKIYKDEIEDLARNKFFDLYRDNIINNEKEITLLINDLHSSIQVIDENPMKRWVDEKTLAKLSKYFLKDITKAIVTVSNEYKLIDITFYFKEE